MPHINDHKNRQQHYENKGKRAMSGKTAEVRFKQHVADTVENVRDIIDNLEAGKSTFEDARLDLVNYASNADDIWKGIEQGPQD